MAKKLPRGIRNNNPLNIIHGKAAWQGQATTQSDPNFVQFLSMEYGIRAAVKILMSYRKKGWVTVSDIIRHWCPDNTAECYISNVCRLTGMSRSQTIDLEWDARVISLLDAMIKVECAGYEVDKHILATGYRMAYGR